MVGGDIMNWIEVTTKIGCKNMCSYCPQSTFLKAYKDDKKMMSFEDFKMLLSNVDKSRTHIHFSGFSESMLNDESIDMMIYAFRQGFSVVLYTTLVGFNEEKARKLRDSDMCFHQTRLHEFDGVGFYSDEFNKKSILFKENVKSLDHNIVRVSQPMSRGGTLFDNGKKVGKIKCYENRIMNNVLLPNGDVYLCCSDWSLKHKIGNLYKHHYNSSEFNEERKKVFQLCMEQDSDVICRSCEWSYNV